MPTQTTTQDKSPANQVKLLSSLFSKYASKKLDLEIKLLKIGLKNALCVDRDEEIESLSLGHPVGNNESGKSSVFAVSDKTARIAVTLDGNLHHEVINFRNRIALLENVTEQIDLYVSTLDEEKNYLYKVKFIENKEIKSIQSGYSAAFSKSISARHISNKFNEIAIEFLNITSLTDTQIIKAFEKSL